MVGREGIGDCGSGSRLWMLPAVAMCQFVARNAGIIYTDNKASPHDAIGAADHLARRLDTRGPAASVYLLRRSFIERQHGLEPIRPPHELRWRLHIFLPYEATRSCRESKVRPRLPLPRWRCTERRRHH